MGAFFNEGRGSVWLGPISLNVAGGEDVWIQFESTFLNVTASYHRTDEVERVRLSVEDGRRLRYLFNRRWTLKDNHDSESGA